MRPLPPSCPSALSSLPTVPSYLPLIRSKEREFELQNRYSEATDEALALKTRAELLSVECEAAANAERSLQAQLSSLQSTRDLSLNENAGVNL